jgi:hypothetical protein
MEERLWLHAATHYHAPTAQVAGPHSRAYQNDVTGGRGSLKTTLYKLLGDEALHRKTPFYPLRQGEGHVGAALAEFHCPEPVLVLLRGRQFPFTVRETADAAMGIDLSTTMTEDWALGVASREYGPQADNLMLHYRKEDEPGSGMIYTRFILNDRRLGGTLHATDRSRSNNIADVGAFRGLHFRDKAIGVYGLLPQHENVSSIKLDVFIPGREGLGRVLIGDRVVDSLPCEVPPGVPLIIEDGAIFVGVLPLRHSNLGRSAPVRLEAEDGDLVLSVVVYEGPEKRFWEYSALGGPFYRGNIECGVVVEVAERGRFADAVVFAAHLAAATVEDVTAEGVRHIRYRSGGDELQMRYRCRAHGEWGASQFRAARSAHRRAELRQPVDPRRRSPRCAGGDVGELALHRSRWEHDRCHACDGHAGTIRAPVARWAVGVGARARSCADRLPPGAG